MKISERLDSLCADQPGCRLAAFGDLRTRLVYRRAGQSDCPQEVLDQLSRAAAQTFDLSDQLPGKGAGSQDSVVFLSPGDVQVVVRAGGGSSDFICCICDTAANHGQITDAVRDILHDMAEAS